MNNNQKSKNEKTPNFQRNLDKILENLANSADFSLKNAQNRENQNLANFSQNFPQKPQKPKLLLHACCAPCSSYTLEYLEKYFKIAIFYYNPNIFPEREYQRRFDELQNFCKVFPPALQGKIQIIEKKYNPQEFFDAIKINSEPQLANEAEKGERCRRCYEFRLKATFDYALQNQFDYFCTTLSISPFKDAQKINEIGENLQKKEQNLQNSSENLSKNDKISQSEFSQFSKIPKWLPSDFKKKNGFKRSLQLCKEYSLYRQEYCGCVYSKKSQNMIE